MLAPAALAVAAVLTSDRIVFADTSSAKVLREVVLPGPAAALFAAPDGRVVVPLAGADQTLVISPAGATVRWPGRVFPVFFDEPDRMYIVLSELLLVASYPERLPILRVPVAGLKAPWRAVCSTDGLVVAIGALPAERRLLVLLAEPGAARREIVLADEPRALVMSPGGEWIAAGLGDAVQLVIGSEPAARMSVPAGGTVRALAVGDEGRDLLIGTGSEGAGTLVSVKVNPREPSGMRARSTLALAGPVAAVAATAEEVVAVAGDALVVLDKHGRKAVRQLAVPGAQGVTLLPAHPESMEPRWSDAPPS